MPICEDCSEEFHALETPTCSKCIQLDGKSEIEKVAIRAKPQCMYCSVIYAQLMDPLCKHCCHELGLPRTQNTNLQKTPSGKIQAQKKALEKAVPGIARGMTRVEEMKNKKPYILVSITPQESEQPSKLLCSTSNFNHPSMPGSDSLVFHG
ncbi:hypothetical protein B0H17DRAFT_1125649 [Mycena rosella]|uniref:Uncharacterized protein n=1 Tax=Mycena rosella TaxID=1033263 RepID=A0AAD7GWN2_MYCRO|nr:hypothetical protein B0H17DRAFT_1125649 [Mycena rosella]